MLDIVVAYYNNKAFESFLLDVTFFFRFLLQFLTHVNSSQPTWVSDWTTHPCWINVPLPIKKGTGQLSKGLGFSSQNHYWHKILKEEKNWKKAGKTKDLKALPPPPRRKKILILATTVPGKVKKSSCTVQHVDLIVVNQKDTLFFWHRSTIDFLFDSRCLSKFT